MGSNPENETVPNRALAGATSAGTQLPATSQSATEPNKTAPNRALAGATSADSESDVSTSKFETEREKQDTALNALNLYRVLNEKITKIQEEIKGVQQNGADNLKELKEDTEKRVEKIRVSFIETIGIFVALFTFISIEFNVFRIYSAWQAVAGLTLVLLGSIAFLVLVFHSFILLTARTGAEKYRWSWIEWLTLIFSVIFIAGGALLIAVAPMEMDDGMGTSIDTRVQTATQAEWQGTHDALTDVQDEVEAVNTRVNAGDTRLRECVKKFGVVRQCFE